MDFNISMIVLKGITLEDALENIFKTVIFFCQTSKIKLVADQNILSILFEKKVTTEISNVSCQWKDHRKIGGWV